MSRSIIVIEDRSDPRLDPFRNIKGQSVRADGTFVTESELVLERLFESSITVRSVLITPARAERLDGFFERYLSRLAADVPVYVAAQSLIDEVVGYPLHRGVIAVAERPVPLDPVGLLGASRTVVVLEHVMDPDNVGSVFRHAAGFGADAVVLHGHTGDPLYRKTIRTSMGWTIGVPYARVPDGEPTITELLHREGYVTLALTPSRDAELLTDVLQRFAPHDRVALLFGAEGPGLRPETMAQCRHRVRIPLSDGVDSLNIATSAAIALYALISAQPSRLC